jgi:signal transduction histidine kinase
LKLSTVQRYLLSIAIILAALLVRVVMAPLWETTAPFALFMCATVLAAWFCGIGPALLTGSAGLVTRLYFDSPRSGAFVSWEEAVRLGLFGVFVLGSAVVLNRMRNDRRQLEASIAAARREIDERRHVEEDLVAARASAEAANRLKDEFLALVSHELRTPLNAILGWVTLLRNGALPPDRSMYALEIIHKNATTQTQLVTDLLDIARGLTGQFQLEQSSVDLQETVRAVVRTSRDAADARRITLWLDARPEPLPVWGDPARVEQAVRHLLANALKFTPEGGEVGVSLARQDDLAELTVTDSGDGIDPEFVPYLFEPFRQGQTGATRQYGGLGLGLALVHQIVQLHGGTVSGESAGPDGGARFSLRFPLHEGAPALQSCFEEDDRIELERAPEREPTGTDRGDG